MGAGVGAQQVADERQLVGAAELLGVLGHLVEHPARHLLGGHLLAAPEVDQPASMPRRAARTLLSSTSSVG